MYGVLGETFLDRYFADRDAGALPSTLHGCHCTVPLLLLLWLFFVRILWNFFFGCGLVVVLGKNSFKILNWL